MRIGRLRGTRRDEVPFAADDGGVTVRRRGSGGDPPGRGSTWALDSEEERDDRDGGAAEPEDPSPPTAPERRQLLRQVRDDPGMQVRRRFDDFRRVIPKSALDRRNVPVKVRAFRADGEVPVQFLAILGERLSVEVTGEKILVFSATVQDTPPLSPDTF